MRKLLYTLFLLVAVNLQGKAHADKAEIQNINIEKNNESVLVQFDILSSDFPSDYSLTLTPVIYNGEGKWKKLEQVTLVGKKRNISDLRTGNISGQRHLMKRKGNDVIPYSFSFPYEEWMQYISLSVEQISEGCCSEYEYPMETKEEGILLEYQPIPYYEIKLEPYELSELEKYDLDNPFLHPMEDYEKRFDIFMYERASGSSVLLFKVNSHRIDTEFEGNKDVLEAIRRAFELIENDPNAVLNKIVIGGYASPEGSLANNTRLGQQRAEAVKSYIQTLMKAPQEDVFELYNGREDWIGLRDLVEKSMMEDKVEILNIIDSYTMEQEIRKTKLKQFKNGVPYKYMLANLYPSLRSAGYIQIYYDMQRSLNGAKVITDEQGRSTWIDPDSPHNRFTTAFNKAVKLMVDEKYNEALNILIEFTEEPNTWNNIGICYMMTGDYEQAEIYFNKALLENKDTYAEKNLEQLEWTKKLRK